MRMAITYVYIHPTGLKATSVITLKSASVGGGLAGTHELNG